MFDAVKPVPQLLKGGMYPKGMQEWHVFFSF